MQRCTIASPWPQNETDRGLNRWPRHRQRRTEILESGECRLWSVAGNHGRSVCLSPESNPLIDNTKVYANEPAAPADGTTTLATTLSTYNNTLPPLPPISRECPILFPYFSIINFQLSLLAITIIFQLEISNQNRSRSPLLLLFFFFWFLILFCYLRYVWEANWII